MGLEQVVIAARVPWQNGYAERFIGSLRRECLDHVIARDEWHLLWIVRSYVAYYNRARTHLALGKIPLNRDRFNRPLPARLSPFRKW